MSAVVPARGPLDLYQLVRRHMPERLESGEQVLEDLGQHIRFRGYLGFEHPAGEIARVDSSSRPVQVYLHRNTVAGLLGPLPEPYFQWCYERMRAGDSAMAAFFDIFNHRINALRYWIRARREPGLAPLPPEQSLAGKLISAFGGGTDRRRQAVPDSPIDGRTLLGLAGLLIYGPRSLSLLARILRQLLNWRLSLEGFRGGWLALEPQQRTALGRRNSTLSADGGNTAQLGGRVWDQHLGLRIQVQMQDPAECADYLPGGGRHSWLCQLLRLLTGFRYDLELCFRFASYPATEPLGSERLRLAQGSWLPAPPGSKPEWDIRVLIPAQEGAPYEAF